MDLLQRTYELIDLAKDMSQREIAAGAGVKRDWYAKFEQRAIKSPGVPKVRRSTTSCPGSTKFADMLRKFH
jgi:hypothetical protein